MYRIVGLEDRLEISVFQNLRELWQDVIIRLILDFMRVWCRLTIFNVLRHFFESLSIVRL
jgi:hypothetical protein